jgi:hypothetical protein
MPCTIEKEAIGRGSTVDKEDGTRERRIDEYILIKEGKCVGLGSSCRKLYKLEILEQLRLEYLLLFGSSMHFDILYT